MGLTSLIPVGGSLIKFESKASLLSFEMKFNLKQVSTNFSIKKANPFGLAFKFNGWKMGLEPTTS